MTVEKKISIICAIEGGHLEAQTILMTASLRRFGGPLSQARAVAFQGRRTPKPSRETLNRLRELSVDYVFHPGLNPAPWFNYSNKIAAVKYAEENFGSEYCLWLDSDVIVLGIPAFIENMSDVDFFGRFESLPPAAVVGDGTYEQYWSRVCELCDIDFTKIEQRRLDFPDALMRPYFNSGVFAWRRESKFIPSYVECFDKVLHERISPGNIGPWFADQVAITLATIHENLNWEMLKPTDHLMFFQGRLQDAAFEALLPEARILHYSKSRTKNYKALFDNMLLASFPAMLPLLREADSVSGKRPWANSVSPHRIYYALRQRLYARSCREL